MDTPQKILVVGGSDATGQVMTTALADAGMTVRVLAPDAAAVAAIRAAGTDAVEGDLAKPGTLGPALMGMTKALVLAAPDPKQAELHGNLLAAAKAAGISQIVKLSALGAAVDAPFVIGRWHAQTDALLAESGIPFTILRPSMFMQNLLSFAPMIASEGIFTASMGEGKVGLVDARDVAAVAALALATDAHAGKTYELTGPDALSYADVAEKVSKETGGPVLYTDIPAVQLKEQLAGTGMPEWLAAAMADLYVAGQQGALAAVTGTVKELTGMPPRSFAAFVHEHVEEFRGEAKQEDEGAEG